MNVGSTCRLRVGFTYRRKPWDSRFKGASKKLWYAQSQWPVSSFRLNFVKNVCLDYYSRNLVLFNFRDDNARVFQRVSMNLNMTVGQAACQLLCRYTFSTLAASCVCWIVPIATCDYQKNLWLFMFEMHLISGITDEPPSPCQAKCKNRAHT